MSNENWTPDDGPSTPLSIFAQTEKKSEKSPDYRGDCILTDTLISQIANLRNAGMQAVLGYAAWTKATRSGSKYLGGTMSVDLYRMAKRYGKSREEIQAIMDSGKAPEAAPQARSAPDPSSDLFSDSAPAAPADPFADTPAPSAPATAPADTEEDPFA